MSDALDEPPLAALWQLHGLRSLCCCEGLGQLAGSAMQGVVLWWLAVAGGAGDLAVYAGVSALGLLLAMPLLSPWADRGCKRRLIRLGHGLLLIDALALSWAAGQGLYAFSLLCASGLLVALAQAVLLPAQAACLPELVGSDALPAAIRLRRSLQALGSLAGPALSAVALSLGSTSHALLLALLLHLAALLAACRLRPSPRSPGAPAQAVWRKEVLAGLRAKWRVKLDRWWTLCGAFMMVFFLPAIGLLLPLRVQSMRLSPAWCGACSMALSLGVLLGVLRAAPWIMMRCGPVRALAGAVVLCALALLGLGWFAQPGLWLACFAVIGLGMSVTQLLGQTQRTLAVPTDFSARMAAAQLCCAQLAASAGPWLAGGMLSLWPVERVQCLLALGFAIAGLALLCVPELPLFLRLEREQAWAWYERRYPLAFDRPAKPG